MGRVVDPADAATTFDCEAERVRRARWIDMRLALWGAACDPPPSTEMFEPLRRAHARARLLSAGPARDTAVEDVAREFCGADVLARWHACMPDRPRGRGSSS